jgi:hypothetical protein
VNIDRIVLTTFPGYFFTQILSLRSIQQYAAGFPIDIIIDDFDLSNWPNYTNDCEQYVRENFPKLDITFYKFSNFAGMERVRTGGWFRQQLVKLYLDQFVPGDRWLLVDADVVFEEPPKLETLSATVHAHADPINVGNRLYVANMLGTDKPWVVNEHKFWCLSSVPFRPLQRDLLTSLRTHIETLHNTSLFELHLDLFAQNKLVAFDPESKTMVFSEFQLIEVFRHRYYHTPLPIGQYGPSRFSHSSIKDWNTKRNWFEERMPVSEMHWQSLTEFGKHHV